MATTTNYSWTTPDDTDLVKDGAAAIRTLGTAIDSTVFTNAGNAIAKTIVDAKGDIIAATAADTVSRLAVGANDTVLIADSSTATGLKWGTISAGSLTLLSTTTLSGASTTVSSISQSYKNLFIHIREVYLGSDDEGIRLQLEADASNHAYGRFGNGGTGSTFNGSVGIGVGSFEIGRGGTSTQNNRKFNAAITIVNYTATTTRFIYANSYSRTNAGDYYVSGISGTYIGSTAVDEITVSSAGSFSGGTMLIYGVN